MANSKRIAGTVLLLISVAVGIQLIAAQIYATVSTDLSGVTVSHTVWRVLYPFINIGMLIVLVVAWRRKRRVDASTDHSVSREWLEANGVFYFAAAMSFLVLWHWVRQVAWYWWSGFGFSVGTAIAEIQMQELILVSVALLMASTGIRLLRE